MPDTLEPTFAPGDPVYKTGAYGGPGKVIGIAEDEHGRTYCVAHRIEGGHGRFVHVYPERFLLRRPEGTDEPGAVSDLQAAAEHELARCWSCAEQIRTKHAAKPTWVKGRTDARNEGNGATQPALTAPGLIAKAKGQVAYWRNRQRLTKSLEDGYAPDGNPTPIGDAAAWEGGYCNGRLSEADWWLKTLEAGDSWRPTHRHLERGSEYQVVGAATLMVSGREPGDYAQLVVYRDAHGQTWAREKNEFEDGRFAPIEHGLPGQGDA